MPGDSFNYAEQYLLLAVLLVGLVVLLALVAYLLLLGMELLFRRSQRKGVMLRAIAVFASCVALSAYLLGAIHLVQDESGADALCQATIPAAYSDKTFVYDVSFMPLRGQCRVDGVGTFGTGGVSGDFGSPVPTYVNPTVVIATFLAIASLIAARWFPGKAFFRQRDSARMPDRKAE